MNRQLICIGCPRGCALSVEMINDEIHVQGNNCIKGEQYAKEEVTDPKRNIASTVLVKNGKMTVAPVAVSKPVRKKSIMQVMDKIRRITIMPPLHMNDVIYRDIDGDGTDLIVTCDVE